MMYKGRKKLFQLSQLKLNDVEWDEIELLGKFHAYEMTSKYYVIRGRA